MGDGRRRLHDQLLLRLAVGQRERPGPRRADALGPVPRRSTPDTPSKVAIGGINLGVGGYSNHPELASEAVACLVGEENQIVNATKGGLLPVTEALYEDPELTEATVDGRRRGGPGVPVRRRSSRRSSHDAVVRPQTPYYNDVALAIARTLHPTRDIDPEKDVERLRDAITDALNGEGLL